MLGKWSMFHYEKHNEKWVLKDSKGAVVDSFPILGIAYEEGHQIVAHGELNKIKKWYNYSTILEVPTRYSVETVNRCLATGSVKACLVPLLDEHPF
jgi:hypothetical protein